MTSTVILQENGLLFFISPKLLTGLLKCSECGGNVVIVSGGRFAKYGCSTNWHKGSAVCSSNWKISKDELERAVLDRINLDFANEEIISYLMGKASLFIRERIKNKEPRWHKDALQDQLKRTEKKIKNFIAAIQAGIITETVKEKLLEAEGKKKDIEEKLSRTIDMVEPEIPEVTREVIFQALNNLHETLSADSMLGKEFLANIISEIRLGIEAGRWKVMLIINPAI